MAAKCDLYEKPGQTCMTAGLEVVAAEGLCGPCAMRIIQRAPARPPHPDTMAGRP